MKTKSHILISLAISFLLIGCLSTPIKMEGSYTDSSGLDTIEIKRVEGLTYTIGNKLSQLSLQRDGDDLHGVTARGDTVKMFFKGDSAHYHIMGISTIYKRNP